jgi:hypothetical protein
MLPRFLIRVESLVVFAGITGAPAFYVPQGRGASWMEAGMAETRLRAEAVIMELGLAFSKLTNFDNLRGRPES